MSPEANPEGWEARSLRNDFQAVHLYSLRHWPEAIDHAPPESGGPYVIIQTGIDPDNPGADVDHFILGRSGRWISLSVFRRLSREFRRENYLFSMAAEAIEALQGLVGRPEIDRDPPGSDENGTMEAADETVEDPIHGAIRLAHEKGPSRGTAM